MSRNRDESLIEGYLDGLLPDGVKTEAGLDTDSMIDRGVEYASGFQEVEFTLRQTMKTPAFWMIAVAMAAYSVVFGGFNVHCIPFLTDRGIDETAAGAMMGLMIFFTIPSRFISGIIADRVRKNKMPFLLAAAFFIVESSLSYCDSARARLGELTNVCCRVHSSLFQRIQQRFQPLGRDSYE